jgi:hypothetical protein
MRPASLALMEVRARNLGSVLLWLADARHWFPQASFIALIDRTLCVPANRQRNASFGNTEFVVDSLLEAGATEVANSPRHLQHIFALAARHEIMVADSQRRSEEPATITDWAWSLLPWQRSE